MDNSKQIKAYLQANGKTHSWREIADMFNVQGTSKQKSDYVRRLMNSINRQENTKYQPTKFTVTLDRDWMMPTQPIVPTYTTTSTKWIDKAKGLEWDNNLGDYNEFVEWKNGKSKPVKAKSLPKPYLNGNPDNVIVLGDIHEPFCKEGYLEFCREQQERFDCGTVIFIGDCTDSNFSSFHTVDPDGMSAGMELEAAIAKLQNWHSVFPKALVCSSNHDRIISRKIYAAGLSQRWMRPLEEVLGVPNWKFVDEVNHKGVMYVHGEGGTAFTKAKQELKSVVQGHLHSEGYIQLMNGGANFAMQVGTGIDFTAYAFAYAKRDKKPILSCGVVLNGVAPILIPYL